MIEVALGIRRKQAWEVLPLQMITSSILFLNQLKDKHLVEYYDRRRVELSQLSKQNQFQLNEDALASYIVDEYFHRQRAELLHSLSYKLMLDVTNWGGTDDLEPHEVVEIIVALGSAGIITAIVNIIKSWLDKDKVQEASIHLPNGTNLNIKRATAEEILSFIETTKGLSPDTEDKKLPSATKSELEK